MDAVINKPTYTIRDRNEIAVHAEAFEPAEGVPQFRTHAELAALSANWPGLTIGRNLERSSQHNARKEIYQSPDCSAKNLGCTAGSQRDARGSQTKTEQNKD